MQKYVLCISIIPQSYIAIDLFPCTIVSEKCCTVFIVYLLYKNGQDFFYIEYYVPQFAVFRKIYGYIMM